MTRCSRMTRSPFVLAAIVTLAGGCSQPPPAPAPAPVPAPPTTGVGAILRVTPAFDELVPTTAVIEKVAGGFQFTEGPLWRPDGTLWFSDVVGNVLRSV